MNVRIRFCRALKCMYIVVIMNNAYFSLLRMTWRYAAGRRVQYVIAYIFFAVANLLGLLEPLLLGLFFNRLQQDGLANYKGALFILAAYPLLQLMFWVFHGTARVLERVNTYHIVKNFRADLFDTLTSIPLKWHKDHHSGELMSRLEKASAALKNFADEGFMYHEVIVKFTGSAVALFVISLYSGMVAIIFGFFASIIIFRFDKLLVAYIKKINKIWHVYDATFYDYIVNIRTVVTLRLEKLAKSEILSKFKKVKPIWQKNAKVNELKWFLLTMVIAFLIFTVMAFYLFQKSVAGEVLLLGTLVALYEYVSRYTGVFFDLAWKYENLVHLNADVDSIQPIWDAKKLYQNNGNVEPINASWQNIQLKNLYFRYEDEKHRNHNLKNINLEFKRGERIAFVGESGSGKSTMMTLLRGLQEPDRVKVIVDGKQAQGLRSLSDQVTLIPQDPEIFENTIEYNVTAGVRHTKKDIENAIYISRFVSVLKRLPKGFKTSIKEKGVNLSGGERQRLALARGVFAAKHSSVVLLDEPTSSVDSANELKIYDNIFSAFTDKCLVSSIHRLHLLPKFDKIYFFQNGQVLAEGSFEVLLKNCSEFAKVWEVYKKSIKK